MAASPSGGLVLSGITKRYRDRDVVRDLNLSVPEGKLLALLGPSGSGKSTTLNVVAGFVRPDAGSVRVGGEDVTGVPTHRRNFGMVFQSNTLFPHMTVARNIAYGMEMHRVPAADRRRRMEDVLEMVGLPDRANAYPSELSGGEQQRIALARALTLEPRLLLLDEPLSGIDAKLRRGIREQIRVIQQRRALTTILVTHDQEEALAIGDVVAVVDKGRLQQVDVPERVYRSPANLFVAEFVGENNLLPGELLAADAERSTVRLAGGTVISAAACERLPAAGSAVHVVVRPDEVTLRAAGPGGVAADPGDNAVAGTVRVAQFLGARRRYVIDADGCEKAMNVDAAPYPAHQPGDRVHLRWRAADSPVLAP